MVDIITMDGRVQLKIKTGTDSEGKDVFVTRTYPRVKADAANENVYNAGKALGNLYKGQLAGVFRLQTVELVEF
jgi:hypothetical protein